MGNQLLFGRRGPFPPLAIAALRSARALAQFLAVALLLIFCSRASALDPSFDASQYGHKSWKVRDGFVNGRVAAITQTTDGYLWLGTVTGLFRFDGVRAVPFKPFANQRLPSDDIRSLLGTRDGSLWIGTPERPPQLEGRQAHASSRTRRERGQVIGAGRQRVDLGRGGVKRRVSAAACATSPRRRGARCYGDDGTSTLRP